MSSRAPDGDRTYAFTFNNYRQCHLSAAHMARQPGSSRLIWLMEDGQRLVCSRSARGFPFTRAGAWGCGQGAATVEHTILATRGLCSPNDANCRSPSLLLPPSPGVLPSTSMTVHGEMETRAPERLLKPVGRIERQEGFSDVVASPKAGHAATLEGVPRVFLNGQAAQ